MGSCHQGGTFAVIDLLEYIGLIDGHVKGQNCGTGEQSARPAPRLAFAYADERPGLGGVRGKPEPVKAVAPKAFCDVAKNLI